MPNKHSFAALGSDIKHKRSTFDIPHRHLTTADFGDIVPFYTMEVMPGDTFQVNTRMFCRMSTPLYPVMDDAYVEYNYFFVPMRLLWSRWAEFLGENPYSAWTQEVDYIIPHHDVVANSGDVYDHFGIPTYSSNHPELDAELGPWLEQFGLEERPKADINILPIRAYWLIYNEWYRNQNTTDGVLVNTGDEVSGNEIERYRTLAKSAKPFDPFTSALPAPQKGDPVTVGLIDVPVITKAVAHDLNNAPLMMEGDPPSMLDRFYAPVYGYNPGVGQYVQTGGVQLSPGEDNGRIVAPSNLYAKTSDASIGINELRQAFAMQRLLELQARGGSRLVEIIANSFGVLNSDSRLQRPEYLGGKTAKIQMQQVAQVAPAAADGSPLGRVGAFSKTIAESRDFNYSFTEHGYVIGVLTARHSLTYQQGLEPMWSRRGRFDIYWPNFANISEQPIYKRSLFLTGTDSDNDVFGYQEAWWDYRYKPSMVTGHFRSTVRDNLDEWHYADVYNTPPTLSDGWMQANGTTVDRTLAVTSAVHDQLLFDIAVDLRATRPMPLYSTPGLIDRI